MDSNYQYIKNGTQIINATLDFAFYGSNSKIANLINVYQLSEVDSGILLSNESHIFKSTTSTGMPWDLSEGYTLTMKDVSLDADEVWFELSKNDDVVKDDILDEDALNTSIYTLGNGNISYVVDSVFGGANENVVKISNLNQYSDISGELLINNSTHLYKTGNPDGVLWSLPDGYLLSMKGVDRNSEEVWFELFKDGNSLKEDISRSNALFTYVNGLELFNCLVSGVMHGTLVDVVKIADIDLYSDTGVQLIHNGSRMYATSNPSGEIWQLSEGYSLDPKDVDVDGRKVWLSLSKDGTVVKDEIIDELDANAGRWFNYYNSSGELVFSTYVDVVLKGQVDNSVFLKSSTQYSEINGTLLLSIPSISLRTGLTSNYGPIVTILSPLAITNDSTPLLHATFDQKVASVWYVIDGAAGTGGFNTDNLTVTLSELADGQHTVKVYANNIYGNVGNATQDFLVDTTAPTVVSVTLNNTVVKSGASIEVNVSATDANEIVTITINDSALILIDGYYIGTITADASPVIVSVTDEAGNMATNSSATYTIDDDKPVVNISEPQQNGSIRFVDNIVRGTVTDANFAFAQLIVINETDGIVGLPYDLIIEADGSFIERVEYAPDQSNILELYATDLAGNSNSTMVQNVSVQDNTVHIEDETVEQNKEIIIDAINETDALLVVNANVNTSINVTITAITNVTQLDNLSNSSALKVFGNIVEIYVDGINASNTSEVNYVTVRMYYTMDDLDLDGNGVIETGDLDEENISIFWYNDTHFTGDWVKLIKGNPIWVDDVGRESTGVYSGYVWAKIHHLSTFGMAAGSVPESTGDDGDGNNNNNNGNSGGGGSGSSGEAYGNIAVKEVIRNYISVKTKNTYQFEGDANAIDFVTFDAKTNAGYIAATVEVLRNTSTLVLAAPSGKVYQNMNIWVGTSGYATENNIANPVIGFKVAKSWITENDIDESTIKLNRYSSSVWNQLPTAKTGEDNSYIYLSSETLGFSPFAITGNERSSTVVADTDGPLFSPPSSIADDDVGEPVGETTNVPYDETKSSSGFVLIIGLIVVSLLGVGVYLRKDKK